MLLFTIKSTFWANLPDSRGTFFSQGLWIIAKFAMTLIETGEGVVTEGIILTQFIMALNQVIQNSKKSYFCCFSLFCKSLQALNLFFLISFFSEIKR